MTDEVFRAASPEDASALAALTNAVYAKWVPILGRLPLPMQVDYDEALRSHEFMLAVRDGALVGLIETEDRADHLYIVNVAVAEANQSRGLGRRLIAHAERSARAKGFGEVRLMTNALYEVNVRLYTFLGYEIYARENFLNGVGVLMRKRIEWSSADPKG